MQAGSAGIIQIQVQKLNTRSETSDEQTKKRQGNKLNTLGREGWCGTSETNREQMKLIRAGKTIMKTGNTLGQEVKHLKREDRRGLQNKTGNN